MTFKKNIALIYCIPDKIKIRITYSMYKDQSMMKHSFFSKRIQHLNLLSLLQGRKGKGRGVKERGKERKVVPWACA